jgi:hypothetical protein
MSWKQSITAASAENNHSFFHQIRLNRDLPQKKAVLGHKNSGSGLTNVLDSDEKGKPWAMCSAALTDDLGAGCQSTHQYS